MSNKYSGKCHACGCYVKSNTGHVEKIGGRWQVWCLDCFDRSDNSSAEDRACGDRAYEDSCAEQCSY